MVWESVVVLCMCVLCVWILCGDGRSKYLYIVLGGYLRILGALVIESPLLGVGGVDTIYTGFTRPL